MKKILQNKWFICIFLIVIFVFTFLVSTHFFHEKENKKEVVVDPVVLPGEDEFEFTNHSSLTDDEVRNLVTTKIEELQKLFYETSYYEVKAIDSTKTEEENENYIAYDEQFLRRLDSLVTQSVYQSIFNKMTLLKNDVQHTYYQVEKTAFDFIYTDSSISKFEGFSSSIRLGFAEENKINASITIQNDSDASEQNTYPFELVLENGAWKVSIL